MSKAALATKTRPVPFMTEAFIESVRALCHEGVGVAVMEKGFKSALGSQRSTLVAGQWLQQRVDDLEIGPGDIGRDHSLCGDPLIVNSTKVNGRRRKLLVPETVQAAMLREEMREINGWLACADIEYAFCAVTDGVDCGKRYLKRVFNNGSLDLGGRLFHGFWQDMPGASRLNGLRLAGERVVSLDFAQMAVRVAYSEVGAVAPVGDLYAVPKVRGTRAGFKKVINALLAVDGLPSRLPAGTRVHFPSGVSFKDVYAAIRDFHAPLVPLFGSASALRFMNVESRVIVKALLALKAMDIVALPIHDCLLVGEGSAATARKVLEWAFHEITGVPGQVEVENKHLKEISVVPLKKGA